MEKKKVVAPILAAGGGGAYIEIPFDVEKEFKNKRPKINALFEGKIEYRGILTKMGTNCHLLIVLKDIREKLSKSIGDDISVEIWLDTTPRVVEIPKELQEAFQENTTAEDFFKSLSYTCQKEYVQYITEAKKAETRVSRTLKTIEMLNKRIKTPK